MARIDNLTNFLTDVADSIREKKGTNEPILASNFDTEISSIETGGSEYEYAEFDPFNVFEILDNDTEPYESKMIFLYMNNGNNTVNISGNLFTNIVKVKTSDGQIVEKPSTGSFQVVFDEEKDIESPLGMKVRYLIAYSNVKKTINLYFGAKVAESQRVLIYYFKNMDLYIERNGLLYDGAITKLVKYDENSKYTIGGTNPLIAYAAKSLLEFELTSENSGNVLYNGFFNCTALKKSKINLSGITSLDSTFSGDSSLESVEFYNCPETTIDDNSCLAFCQNLLKFTAYPYYKVNSTTFFSSNNTYYNIKEISGIDLGQSNGGIHLCSNLVKIERIKNINLDFYLDRCPQVSFNSLINCINALNDFTDGTAKKFNVGTINKAKLEQTEEGMQAIALAVSKNWTVS